MPDRLKGKIAIVTGAARGLGREYACCLAAAGAAVIAADRRDCTQTVTEVETAGGKALGLDLDVADSQSTQAMADGVLPGAADGDAGRGLLTPLGAGQPDQMRVDLESLRTATGEAEGLEARAARLLVDEQVFFFNAERQLRVCHRVPPFGRATWS